MARPSAPQIIRLLLIMVWVVLFALLIKRDVFVRKVDINEAEILRQSRQESYSGVYFSKKRIGYVKTTMTPKEPAGFTLEQSALINLQILDARHPVRLTLTAGLTDRYLLEDFNFTLTSPLYQIAGKGHTEPKAIVLTINTGKEIIHDRIPIKSPPFLSSNQRAYLLNQKLTPGDKIKIPYFDPISMSGQDTVMEYRGKEKILIKGRIQLLHHFSEKVSGIRINSWLDDSGKVIKEESPAGFVFLAEPKFQALDVAEPADELLSSVSAPLTGTLPDLATVSEIRYRLNLPEDVAFDLSGGRQQFADPMLTVRREPLPAPEGNACPAPQYLKATPYIQAEHKLIKELAASLTSGQKNALDRTKAIAGWVYEHIEKRPVLGIPDALTTFLNRRGDCNEHAALFAALARSAGIPARVVAGVTYQRGAFYYHAWNEVCIADNWLSVDTTVDQMPADLSHIRFIEGEGREMIKIGALLGKLAIEVVVPEQTGTGP